MALIPFLKEIYLPKEQKKLALKSTQWVCVILFDFRLIAKMEMYIGVISGLMLGKKIPCEDQPEWVNLIKPEKQVK